LTFNFTLVACTFSEHNRDYYQAKEALTIIQLDTDWGPVMSPKYPPGQITHSGYMFEGAWCGCDKPYLYMSISMRKTPLS